MTVFLSYQVVFVLNGCSLALSESYIYSIPLLRTPVNLLLDPQIFSLYANHNNIITTEYNNIMLARISAISTLLKCATGIEKPQSLHPGGP